jgi:hypothetical protein
MILGQTTQKILLPAAGCIYAVIITSMEKLVRFEVFTAVTMKNVIFWDIKSQFILHRRHIMSLLQSPAS